MSFSKQQVEVAAIALALLVVTSHLAAGAEAEAEAITPQDTCEFPICVPCWGKNSICIAACIAIHYTGGFCKDGKCVCTKQCLAEAEVEVDERGLLQPPVQPPLGKRGMGMLN